MRKGVTQYDWHCPYCGAGGCNEDDHYLVEGEHFICCGRCGKDFTVSVRVSYTFEVLKEVDKECPLTGLFCHSGCDPFLCRRATL